MTNEEITEHLTKYYKLLMIASSFHEMHPEHIVGYMSQDDFTVIISVYDKEGTDIADRSFAPANYMCSVSMPDDYMWADYTSEGEKIDCIYRYIKDNTNENS